MEKQLNKNEGILTKINSDDIIVITESSEETQEDSFEELLESVWNKNDGESIKLMASYIQKVKMEHPVACTKETMLKLLSDEIIPKNPITSEEDALFQLNFLIHSLDVSYLYNEHMIVHFLQHSKRFSLLETNPQMTLFCEELWKRLETGIGSSKLLQELTQVYPNYLYRKLESIENEADTDGWNLIRYITGYDKLLEICSRKCDGAVFQTILNYFVSKAKQQNFSNKVSQQLATSIFEDIRCRCYISDYIQLFPRHLLFYSNMIGRRFDINKQLIVEMLMNLKQESLEDFLLLAIGYTECHYLIKD